MLWCFPSQITSLYCLTLSKSHLQLSCPFGISSVNPLIGLLPIHIILTADLLHHYNDNLSCGCSTLNTLNKIKPAETTSHHTSTTQCTAFLDFSNKTNISYNWILQGYHSFSYLKWKTSPNSWCPKLLRVHWTPFQLPWSKTPFLPRIQL